MHQAREILRQKLALGRSHRQIAASLGVSASTVSTVVGTARALGLDANTIEKLTDAELEGRLHPKPTSATITARPEPDCAALDIELRRPGVTLALLHIEYLTEHPDGLRSLRSAIDTGSGRSGVRR